MPHEEVLTIQIGNTDNKLSRQEWSLFIREIGTELRQNPLVQIHFAGGSSPEQEYENYCFVAVADINTVSGIQHFLASMAGRYKQDSIAFTRGYADFIKPAFKHLEEHHYG